MKKRKIRDFKLIGTNTDIAAVVSVHVQLFRDLGSQLGSGSSSIEVKRHETNFVYRICFGALM